jgi:hypothetical protein
MARLASAAMAGNREFDKDRFKHNSAELIWL